MKIGPVIGFSGAIRSGKSAVARRFAEAMGWQHVSFGDYIRKLAAERRQEPNRDNLQEIGARMVQTNLESFCADVLHQVDWSPGQALVVDGIRHTEVQFTLRQLVMPSPFVLIYLQVPEEVRLDRLREEAELDPDRLKRWEHNSTEVQVTRLLPDTADYILDGAQSTEALIEQLKELISLPYREADEINPGLELETTGPIESANEQPFDPSLIRVESKLYTLDLILTRIREEEIDLTPDFQRQAIWTHEAQSLLIESVLLRIPLPAFYMDATNDDRWLVVDGLQRLTALTRFVVRKDLRLRGLEFLKSFENKSFDDLPRAYCRRIVETQITVFLIEKETPPEFKFNIFRRINTGGLPLSPQEIRHALNQGPATRLLASLASYPGFLAATGGNIRPDRMADREMVLRFLAFSITPYTVYKASDFDRFLNDAMVRLNSMTDSERDELARRFHWAMDYARLLFGELAFRKRPGPLGRKLPVNKALFEAWSVNLGMLDWQSLEALVARQSELDREFQILLKDSEFNKAISQATGNVAQVSVRFRGIEDAIRRVLP